MPLTIACSCGQHYAVEEQHAGQQVSCPMCGALLSIPFPNRGPRQTPPPRQPPRRSGMTWVVVILVGLLGCAAAAVGGAVWLANHDRDLFASVSDPPEGDEEEKPPPKRPAPDRPRLSPKKEKRPDPPPKEEEEPPPKKEKPTPKRPDPPALPPPSNKAWTGHLATVLQVGLEPSGRGLWTAAGGLEERDGVQERARDSTLRRWDLRTGKETSRVVLHPNGVGAAAFSPAGGLAALASPGQEEVRLYDLKRRKVVRTLKEHTKAVRCLAFSGDGRRLLSGGEDRLIAVWDVATGQLLHRLEEHTNAVNQVAVSADGKVAVSAGMDHTVRVWDLERGLAVRELPGHADIVWAVALSADGKRALSGGGMQQIKGIGLVAGSRDHDVRLWDVGSGRLVKRFGMPGPVSALALSGDGRRFLAGGHDGTVRLWQIDPGRELKRLEAHTGRVRALAFFPDRKRGVSGGEGRGVQVWAVPPDLPDLVADLRGDDAKARRSALTALAELGREARPAIPTLFDVLAQRDLQARALEVLRGLTPIGKEHVGRLGRLAARRDFKDGRLFALAELARLGEDARPAAKALLAAVEDPDVAVRRQALTALTPVVDQVKDSAFRPLLKALRDRDAAVRGQAEKALDSLGPPGAGEVKTLRGLLNDEQESVRRYGLRSLAGLGDAAREAAGDISERARKDKSAALRLLALEALGKVGAKGKDMVQAGTRALEDDDVEVGREGAKLLATAGDVPGLIEALQHSDDEVRGTAGKALDRVRFAKRHVPLLTKLIRSRDADARKRGLEALGGLGSDAAEAVPALGKALKAAEGEERNRFLAVLSKIGPKASKAGPAVLALLKETKDLARRFEVCRVLVRIEAAEVSKVVPVLVEVLRSRQKADDDDDAKKDRETARDLLARIGKPAVKPLMDALKGELAGGNPRTPAGVLNGRARREVLRTLTAIGPPVANDVLLTLAAVERGDPFREVRQAAREARVKLQRKE